MKINVMNMILFITFLFLLPNVKNRPHGVLGKNIILGTQLLVVNFPGKNC